MKITNDTSQYGTMTKVADFINTHNLILEPSFLDIGAYDGKTYSNVYPLANENNWSGILVEPNPELMVELTRNYADFPNSYIIYNLAIHDFYGGRWLYLENDNPLLATLDSLTEEGRKIRIVTAPLTHVCSPDSKLGLMSIDTEGLDLLVVKQVLQNNYRPTILITESWPDRPDQNQEKRGLLEFNGYKRVLIVEENEVYVDGQSL